MLTQPTRVSTERGLEWLLANQQAAFRADGIPDLATRIDRLDRLRALLFDNAEDLIDAMTADFGSRPRALSISGDILACSMDIAEQKRHVSSWMKETTPSKMLRAIGFRASVRHVPLGVVGVIGPWNFPLQLSLVPAAAALAAGNRVMVRPSSVTARTAGVLAEHAPHYFPLDEFAVITARHGSGADFAKLRFDSLFFTGSPKVGASVAAAAAANLVPVTLELGGKNPVVVDIDADIVKSAKRIAQARIVNSGQVCLSPDYVFVPEGQVDRFVETVLATWTSMFDSIIDNPDYTSTINDANYTRIVDLIDDAESLGAKKFDVVPHGEALPDARSRKIAPTVLTGVRRGMKIEEREVFGPVLTVYPYRHLDEAIDHIAGHDHPLTLYWYGPQNDRFAYLVARTRSGSVQGNDFLINMVAGLPFGGVGNSGMGLYHGKYGFDTFTHQRTVVHSALPATLGTLLAPPYGRLQRKATDWILNPPWRTDRRSQ